ncbi:hypothetical protein FHS88_002745 [Roseomonas alkaliterrae]|uniref:Uncharacterized protein n=1 Tax=Neoroseomonas alkaliterrae TaxID=1452450 RepID=A0A840XU97_9PROT|nr:hypothetical protein [Neoroseomonas alkaliterrae]MBB5690610.1 hypothetical protein [Neoroseomonas alkaliterrae]
MAFASSGLAALTTANGFTLWHYRTEDDRATVLAPGYFAPAGHLLQPGDIVIVQAADATALVPIRSGAAAGEGLTVDGSGSAPALLRSASLPFSIAVEATAVPRAIALDALPSPIVAGQVFPVGASVTGPIASLTFFFRDAGGAEVGPPQAAPVAAGRASAAFTAPGAGGGFRILAVETADPSLLALSPPFAVSPPPRLLTEAGFRLLLEDGAAILL